MRGGQTLVLVARDNGVVNRHARLGAARFCPCSIRQDFFLSVSSLQRPTIAQYRQRLGTRRRLPALRKAGGNLDIGGPAHTEEDVALSHHDLAFKAAVVGGGETSRDLLRSFERELVFLILIPSLISVSTIGTSSCVGTSLWFTTTLYPRPRPDAHGCALQPRCSGHSSSHIVPEPLPMGIDLWKG
jgi:hypothetical protein